MSENKTNNDYLWIILFIIVFINGFEAGGYQASLWTIGKTYDLSVTSMGLFASVELFATMLAPLVLGHWADSTKKSTSIMILLALQFTAASIILLTNAEQIFIVGVFFLGLTTSALQFISIAALADAYPVSGSRKIGYITSMYALGALVSPLVVNIYLNMGLPWRTLFVLLALGSFVSFFGIMKSGATIRESMTSDASSTGKFNEKSEFYVFGILLLCVIMCIYVGFENGFTFFVDTLFIDVFKSSSGKFALSLFWAVMIPSRVLVGHFAYNARKILITAIIAIPVVTFIISVAQSSDLVMLLCVPLGFASGAIYPCSLNMMLPFAGKRTATATGMITTATGIGGVIFTALTGFMGDKLGMRTAMAILGGFFVFSLIAAVTAIRLSENKNTNAT